MSASDPVVVAAAARTPMGGFLGDLKDVSAPVLGAAAIKSAVERAGVGPDEIDEVIMGLCLFAGLGQAPARQAGRFAGLPDSVGATTISKMCGSAMKAAMLAHDLLIAGTNKVMIAGGMESMSNAPYLLDRARSGYRMGHGQIRDHMFLDGLEDAYDKGRLMGTFAEDTAQAYQFTREQQDSFAIESLKRAQKAITGGAFAAEVVPVAVKSGKTETSVAQDEQPLKAKLDRISSLKPAFRDGGTVTAANSSSISDGAAALVMMRRSEAERRGIRPLAVVRAQATYSQAPAWFTTAPVGAIRKCLDRAGWTSKEVELYEINEAFAVVTLAAMRDLDLPHDKVNVHGGACALGHPVGASGARIIVTLLAAMEKYGARRGLASLCIGGGEATAMAFERVH